MSGDELWPLVEQVYGTLEWPANYYLPLDYFSDKYPNTAHGMNVPMSYPPEFAHTILETNNWCAWVMAAHEAFVANDDAVLASSLDTLERFSQDAVSFVPYDVERMLDGFQKARLGDPSFLQTFVNGGCGDTPWRPNPNDVSRHDRNEVRSR